MLLVKFAKYSIICLAAVIVSCLFGGCASLELPAGAIKMQGASQTGKASYYARKHQNQKTANGERYDSNLKTAAHKKLPFGTRVRVTNTENGKSVIVRINDRGPYVYGRIVDLSRSAFKQIANLADGIIDVRLEVIR